MPAIRQQHGAEESLCFIEVPVLLPHELILAIAERHPDVWMHLHDTDAARGYWQEASVADPKLAAGHPILQRPHWKVPSSRKSCPVPVFTPARRKAKVRSNMLRGGLHPRAPHADFGQARAIPLSFFGDGVQISKGPPEESLLVFGWNFLLERERPVGDLMTSRFFAAAFPSSFLARKDAASETLPP